MDLPLVEEEEEPVGASVRSKRMRSDSVEMEDAKPDKRARGEHMGDVSHIARVELLALAEMPDVSIMLGGAPGTMDMELDLEWGDFGRTDSIDTTSTASAPDTPMSDSSICEIDWDWDGLKGVSENEIDLDTILDVGLLGIGDSINVFGGGDPMYGVE
jgi:hypothetical protein